MIQWHAVVENTHTQSQREEAGFRQLGHFLLNKSRVFFLARFLSDVKQQTVHLTRSPPLVRNHECDNGGCVRV